VNLLTDSWIPIKRKSGKKEMVAIWQLTGGMESDPIIKLDISRPDFKGSMLQFIIAVMQTALPPEDDAGWEKRYKSPPSPETLKEFFKKYEYAFNLDGDGPRFMQELELEIGKIKPISRLLIDDPGDAGEKKNTDHFIKGNRINNLSLPTAAIALFTLQINAPEGGTGNMVSLRRGGPMTTLLMPKEKDSTLWQKIWMNVLPKETFENATGNPEKSKDSDIFPWLAKTKISTRKNGILVTPYDAHPLQVYWSMPRRIRLTFNENEKGVCDLTSKTGEVVSKFIAEGSVKYDDELWRHPLTPYERGDNNKTSSVKPEPGGIGYRHWGGLIFGERDEKKGALPATIVHIHRKVRRRRKYKINLFAFGFDMNQAKVRNWHESIMPFLHIEEEVEENFVSTIKDMVLASTEISKNLKQAVKRVWAMKIKKTKKKLEWKPLKPTPKEDSLFIQNEFWQKTETSFYQNLEALLKIVTEDSDDAPLLQNWFKHLHTTSIELFDRYTTSGSMEYENPERIAVARKQMKTFNRKKTIKDFLKLDQKIEKEEIE